MSSTRKRPSALLSLYFCVSAGLLLVASCRAKSERPATENLALETIVSSTPPFQTKEPERYRATRTITIFTAGGETIVTRNSIARDGPMRRDESEMAPTRVAYLDLPAGTFVLLPDDKVYADLAGEVEHRVGRGDEERLEISPDRLLHTEPINTSYQKIGTESVGGRKANKYRIAVNGSTAGSVSLSETLMWIDEALNMPIKTETTSPDGTRTTMELSDLALDVDKRLFQVPEDYEKITFRELRRRVRKND